MKIVVLDGYAENPGDLSWEGFKKMGEFTVYDRTPREDVEEILHRIGDEEIVCTNKTLIGREVIGRAAFWRRDTTWWMWMRLRKKGLS